MTFVNESNEVALATVVGFYDGARNRVQVLGADGVVRWLYTSELGWPPAV